MKKKILREALLLLIFNCSFIITKAQWVSIPDSNFGKWLCYNGYSQCLQGDSIVGWQMDTTCTVVNSAVSIHCVGYGIHNITGVQYFDNLQSFECHFNELSSLPPLPHSLTYLDCHSNQLTNLPALPNSLTVLDCSNNQLTSLPAIPNSLTAILCYGNLLSSLPTLPNSLITLYCNHNQLGSLPELPDSLESFYCHDNPNLYCFPLLKNIQRFFFFNTGITCLPNYPQSNFFSNPALDSIPLCDSANTSSCAYCHPHFTIYPDTANAGVYYGYNDSYGSNLTSYFWEFGDGDTSGLQFPSHTYAQPGHYYLCLTASSAGCTNTYCDSSFLVFKTEGGLMSQINIIDPSDTVISSIPYFHSEFRITPNPVPTSTSSLTISLGETPLGSNLTITDITGREVLHSAVQIRNPQFDIRNFLPGVYLVSVTAVDGRKAVKKLLVE